MSMKMIAAATALAISAASMLCQESKPALAPTFVLHVPGPRASAMSPDEKSLAVIAIHRPRGAAPSAELQVWDFRTGSVLRARPLAAPELQPRQAVPTMQLRYTSDGELLVVHCGGQTVQVLRSSDLEQLRDVHTGAVSALEIAPSDHRMAVRGGGRVRIYDLDSGDPLWTWIVPADLKSTELLFRAHPQLDGPALAWRKDGNAVAISVADAAPCMRGGGTIFTIELKSTSAAKSFRVPLLPDSVGFDGDDRLYVAGNTCGGYFAHWALDLPAYDPATGREVGKIPADRVGVRGVFSISANKQILVAYADREKTTFLPGFEDTLETKDAQWRVWDLTSRKLLMSVPEKNAFRSNLMDVSGGGHFIYATRMEEVDVYEVAGAK